MRKIYNEIRMISIMEMRIIEKTYDVFDAINLIL